MNNFSLALISLACVSGGTVIAVLGQDNNLVWLFGLILSGTGGWHIGNIATRADSK